CLGAGVVHQAGAVRDRRSGDYRWRVTATNPDADRASADRARPGDDGRDQLYQRLEQSALPAVILRDTRLKDAQRVDYRGVRGVFAVGPPVGVDHGGRRDDDRPGDAADPGIAEGDCARPDRRRAQVVAPGLDCGDSAGYYLGGCYGCMGVTGRSLLTGV